MAHSQIQKIQRPANVCMSVYGRMCVCESVGLSVCVCVSVRVCACVCMCVCVRCGVDVSSHNLVAHNQIQKIQRPANVCMSV